MMPVFEILTTFCYHLISKALMFEGIIYVFLDLNHNNICVNQTIRALLAPCNTLFLLKGPKYPFVPGVPHNFYSWALQCQAGILEKIGHFSSWLKICLNVLYKIGDILSGHLKTEG